MTNPDTASNPAATIEVDVAIAVDPAGYYVVGDGVEVTAEDAEGSLEAGFHIHTVRVTLPIPPSPGEPAAHVVVEAKPKPSVTASTIT